MLTRDVIHSQVDTICSSVHLRNSKRLVGFLRYVVEHALTPDGGHLSEYAIAVDVYDRSAGFDPKSDNIIRAEARRLRLKLRAYYEKEGAADRCIIDLPAGSYLPVFHAPEEPAPEQNRAAAAAPPVKTARHLGWMAASAASILVILAGLTAYWKTRQTAPERIAATRLAILPLDVGSGKPEDANLALAISESLIARLSRVRQLEVVSRTSAQFLKARNASLKEIAQRLNADFVLEGSLVRADADLKVTVMLIKVAGESNVWSEEYFIPQSGILQFQDSASRRIAEALQVRLTAPESQAIHQLGTSNPAAYEAYAAGIAGTARFLERFEPGRFAEAEGAFLRAIELDPNYADAMAELGRLYLLFLFPPQGPKEPVILKATRALERALTLQPMHPAANALLGSLLAQQGDFVRGLEYANKAVTADPRGAGAHNELATVYCSGGFYEEAARHAREALRFDPLSVHGQAALAWNLAMLHRFTEALEVARDLERAGISPVATGLAYADIYYRQGLPDQAEASLRRLGVGKGLLDPESDRLALGLARVMKGDLAEGARIVSIERGKTARNLDFVIRLSALIGDRDVTIDFIERSPFYRNYRWVTTEPSLLPFRSDGRFQALVRRLYADWQRNLAAARPTLTVDPPELPAPEQYIVSEPKLNRRVAR